MEMSLIKHGTTNKVSPFKIGNNPYRATSKQKRVSPLKAVAISLARAPSYEPMIVHGTHKRGKATMHIVPVRTHKQHVPLKFTISNKSNNNTTSRSSISSPVPHMNLSNTSSNSNNEPMVFRSLGQRPLPGINRLRRMTYKQRSPSRSSSPRRSLYRPLPGRNRLHAISHKR
jgi:hypothetical protein